ncbi:MAG TPA: hypothetical protein VLC46_08495 [Thermoanaerobaculia bacterium]|jgi:hypothetical protein|nr:hypothetical protein [Thermoanaerobaculia bacterium]
MRNSLGAAIAAVLVCLSAFAQTRPVDDAAQVPAEGDILGVFGTPVTFATHTQLASYGFSFGPSDGSIGAIPTGGGSYNFYGSAGSSASCTASPKINGTYPFNGTLDHVTGVNGGCIRLFGPGDGPAGYAFDKDYAGGGGVVRFSSGGKSGWLMSFHAEYHWQNLANPPSFLCSAGGNSPSMVPCFYSSIGLAVSTDNGKTFTVAGQIVQPSEPLSVFEGSSNNMAVGYGSLLVADANGRHLDNPPPDPASAYFYVFFGDRLPGTSGACSVAVCLGVARATYADVVTAALSGDGHQVAQLFHKYDGASPDPWTQPATAFVQGSATPDLSGTAGRFMPLWTDEPAASPIVLYDSTFNVYLAVYVSGVGASIKARASSDMIHWSEPIGVPYTEAGRAVFYPTLIGETGDPTIGGPAPRVYFTSFPTGLFPDYSTSVFESVTLTLARQRRRAAKH